MRYAVLDHHVKQMMETEQNTESQSRRRKQLFQNETQRAKRKKKHNYNQNECVAFIQGSHWTVGQITDLDLGMSLSLILNELNYRQ